MKNRIKIARELVKLAKDIVSMSTFKDWDDKDTGANGFNRNPDADKAYEQILRDRYKDHPDVAELLVDMGDKMDRATDFYGGKKGTMYNGNMVLKWNLFPKEKHLTILGFVSKKNQITKSDVPDVINMFGFLKKYVEQGYVILTDCNSRSIPFLATFALWNNYYFHAGEERMEFGDTGDDKDNSRHCVCAKRDMGYGPSNAEKFTMKNGKLLYKLLQEADQL